MSHTKLYQVQYLKTVGKKTDRGWRNVPHAQFVDESSARDYAKKCERGFGETRIVVVNRFSITC